MLGIVLALLGLIALISGLAGAFADDAPPVLIGIVFLLAGAWLLSKVGRMVPSRPASAAVTSANGTETTTPLPTIEGWLFFWGWLGAHPTSGIRLRRVCSGDALGSFRVRSYPLLRVFAHCVDPYHSGDDLS